jgi:DNA-binding PadR family transcriptional regulator
MGKSESIRPHWFQILLSLADQPLHGTAIMEEVRDRTEGAVMLWPGTLYGSLSDLSSRGWIEETRAPDGAPTEGGRRRFYALTAAGHRVLSEEAARLAAYVRVARAKNVLDEAGA